MKNTLNIIFLILSNLAFGQEKYDNEKLIENIENYDVQEITTLIEKTTTIYGTFEEKIKLYGTLITPKTDFDKILVIISGTGKISQNAHNFLTEYLLENNIGVFRFDKRGIGKSTGNYSDFFQIYENDFFKLYKSIQQNSKFQNKKVGILGHSLGGIVSIQSVEENLKPDFLIQWSAPIGKPRDILKYQMRNGIKNYDNQFSNENLEERIKVIDFVNEIIDQNPKKETWELMKIAKKESKKIGLKKKTYDKYLHPNNVEFNRIDNSNSYKIIDFPTLVIIGEQDILVDPKQSKTELNKIGNPNIEFKQIDGLNHFMTKKGVDWKTNEIYNVDLAFKEYIVNWINNIK